jgi:hypothetical protein
MRWIMYLFNKDWKVDTVLPIFFFFFFFYSKKQTYVFSYIKMGDGKKG